MIETRTIRVRKPKQRKPTKAERISAAQEQEARFFNRYRQLEARRDRAKRHITTFGDGVTRCSKCPPKRTVAMPDRFCDDCRRINNARQIAGLIRPRGSPEPHPNNCMPCIPGASIKSRPRTPQKTGAFKVVSIEVKPLGGGWYLGQALLSGKPIYERKFRSRDEARRYAVNSMVDIREGLRFEQLVNEA